ncbi:MAG: CcoQ/FixQ family Cbb3-type cytochrome c oxidase assembly chaperone [Halobacteriovoraceae bacterium]|nr:CcoQ/FixQ family Cbb3-type cytochrome c oxidase assembly chaperone [Halobacteriovoraceae bacterium]MCB9093937.1 CcoQ/FixQ family Cbb3-type cytochrome c oxidase assembly chaperone [Halobacteriovoraceae bacterium]
MKSQVFENFDLTILPTIGMIVFLVVFLFVVIWVFRKNSKKIYTEMSNIPLNEGNNNE